MVFICVHILILPLSFPPLAAGVTRGYLATRCPSWWMESRLHSRPMKRQCTAVPVTVCHLLIPGCRSCCQKGLGPVGGMGQGSSSCKSRGPAPLQAERRRPRASRDYVKPGALRAQRLCWCTRQPPPPGWPAQGTAEGLTKKPQIQRTVTYKAFCPSHRRTTQMVGGLRSVLIMNYEPLRGLVGSEEGL